MDFITRALLRGARHVAKAHGAHKHSRTLDWKGLKIGIENDVGSVRTGTDTDGKAWETQMQHAYGEILGSRGVDGDELDVFVNDAGLDTATHVYIICIADAQSQKFDEEKAFAGFASAEDALASFAAHYDDPEKYFGCISSMPADRFAWKAVDKAQHGRSLTPQAEARVRLTQRARKRRLQAREDRAEWMKALVKKAQGMRTVSKGLSFSELDEEILSLEQQVAEIDNAEVDFDDVDHRPALEYKLGLLRYARNAWTNGDLPVSKALETEGRRLIRIWPGKNAFDLQNELISVDLIHKDWAYYVECGNIDLEHISKTGGKSWREKAAKIEAAGFEPEGKFARIQYEIGRPVPGTLTITEVDETGRVLDFFYVAEIHQGGNEAANWFWRTLPWIPWKPSVGGSMSEPVKVMTQVSDARRGLHRTQEVGVARDFRWNNVGLSLETVNHWVKPVEIISEAELEMILGGVPRPSETVST